MDRPAVRDAALLIFRVIVGIIFIGHGVRRLLSVGLSATTGEFAQLGIPQPKLSTYLVIFSELFGGAFLILGLLSTFVAGALALLMMAAIYFVHMNHGFFVETNGIEFALLLLSSLLMIVVFGAGRVSLDGVFSRAEL